MFPCFFFFVFPRCSGGTLCCIHPDIAHISPFTYPQNANICLPSVYEYRNTMSNEAALDLHRCHTLPSMYWIPPFLLSPAHVPVWDDSKYFWLAPSISNRCHPLAFWLAAIYRWLFHLQRDTWTGGQSCLGSLPCIENGDSEPTNRVRANQWSGSTRLRKSWGGKSEAVMFVGC